MPRRVIIGLLFERARIGCLEQDAGQDGGEMSDLAGIACDKGKGGGHQRSLVDPLQAMCMHDMRDFMGEDTFYFVVTPHHRNHLVGDDDGPVGEREGVGADVRAHCETANDSRLPKRAPRRHGSSSAW